MKENKSGTISTKPAISVSTEHTVSKHAEPAVSKYAAGTVPKYAEPAVAISAAAEWATAALFPEPTAAEWITIPIQFY
jgi:hypothetical protein